MVLIRSSAERKRKVRIICGTILTATAALSVHGAFDETSFALLSSDVRGRVVVDDSEPAYVYRAAQDLTNDICKITGASLPLLRGVGMRRGDVCIRTAQSPEWEAYSVSASNGVLSVVGSDPRGTMFGVYAFVRRYLGVDPFGYWSGAQSKKSATLVWDNVNTVSRPPSFKFRGWFVNDEDFLNGFCPDENGRRSIDYKRYSVCFGPSVAERICESAVRAGFNTMICASYVDILNPDEKRLVDIAVSRGLYVTMHHQEPVGAGALQLDLHFPEIRGTTYASHPNLWRKAWKRYISEWAKVPGVIWMLGLRGRKDLAFWETPKSWKSEPLATEAEDRYRAGLISSAMSEQLAIIEEVTGCRPEHFAVQLWMEGADFYRRGLLDVPDGATVVLSDNCPGLKFQPDIGSVDVLDATRAFGLYYHLAIVHGNHRCELVPPLRAHQILSNAFHKGAHDMVLFNVSNIRPFLYNLAAVGEMSQDIDGFDPLAYRDKWAAKRFGGRAKDVARAIDLYFAAYETEYSRDSTSSYGSPRERAPLAILNDGILWRGIRDMVRRYTSRERMPLRPVVSQYDSDPDELEPVPDDFHKRESQDMYPTLRDCSRAGLRARTQAAAFSRCLEQIDRAARGMDEEQRRQLFERFGYPAEFMMLTSQCFAEMVAAVEAMDSGDCKVGRAHAIAALDVADRRKSLDLRYNEGKWKHWYDRDMIYPFDPAMEELRRFLCKEVEEVMSSHMEPQCGEKN